jgi:DNA-binding MarR family transcriptional regulator
MQTGPSEKPQLGAFELGRFLPYRLSVLANIISQGIAARYRDEHAISVTEWRVLAVLGSSPAQTASDLAKRTAMDKVAIHRAVKLLLKKGMLQRQPDDADRRRQHLRLTGAGKKILETIIPKARGLEYELLAALEPDEARALDRIIEKLTAKATDLCHGSK